MSPLSRDQLQQSMARLAGVTMIVLAVIFQRRGLVHWTEVLFLGLCVGMQEAFIRLPRLRKLRTPMFVVYSALPLLLVLIHNEQIQQLRGDFVGMVLFTPLPLVLVCMQIMVLYLKESPRLVSVVLVLTLFSTVIGVRRPDAANVWPWLLAISAVAATYMALQYPAMIFQGASARRRGPLPPPTPRPGVLMRPAFYGAVAQYAVLAVVAALLLYFLLPRIDLTSEPPPVTAVVGGGNTPGGNVPPPGPNPNPPRNPDGTPKQPSVSGLGDGVDLGDFGEIKKTNTPALRLKPLDEASARLKRVYLRAFTFSDFRAGRWADGTSRAVELFQVAEADLRDLPRAPGRTGIGWAQLSFELELTAAGIGKQGQLPLPVETRALRDYQGPLQYDTRSNTLRAPEVKAGEFFVVYTNTRTLNDAQFATALRGRTPGRLGESMTSYVTMPASVRRGFQTRFDRWQELQRICAGENRNDPIEQRGIYACAREIVRMFHEDKVGSKPKWEYSLTLRPMPGEHSIVSFLDTRTAEAERFGHCEYFASGMCLLLRSFGVPARLCAGFSSDRKDERGEFAVTTGDAHAWVEVWFEGEGWVAFDPTPPGQPDNTEATAELPVEPEQPAPDTAEVAKSAASSSKLKRDWIDGFGNEDQGQLFSSVGGWVRDMLAKGDSFFASITAWMPEFVPRNGWLRLLLLLLLPLALLLGFGVKHWRRGRQERQVLGDAARGMRKQNRGLYLQLLLLLAKHGYTRMATETPMEFAQRVQRKGGELYADVVLLTRLYYDLRYGARLEAEAEFKQRFGEYVTLLRRVVIEKPTGRQNAAGSGA